MEFGEFIYNYVMKTFYEGRDRDYVPKPFSELQDSDRKKYNDIAMKIVREYIKSSPL